MTWCSATYGSYMLVPVVVPSQYNTRRDVKSGAPTFNTLHGVGVTR